MFSPRANSKLWERGVDRIQNSQKYQLPSLPEGLPKLGGFPVSKEQEEGELWDKVTVTTEAGIQEF